MLYLLMFSVQGTGDSRYTELSFGFKGVFKREATKPCRFNVLLRDLLSALADVFFIMSVQASKFTTYKEDLGNWLLQFW